MKYLDKKFSTPANSKRFVDNWDAIFKEEKQSPDDEKRTASLSPPKEPTA